MYVDDHFANRLLGFGYFGKAGATPSEPPPDEPSDDAGGGTPAGGTTKGGFDRDAYAKTVAALRQLVNDAARANALAINAAQGALEKANDVKSMQAAVVSLVAALSGARQRLADAQRRGADASMLAVLQAQVDNLTTKLQQAQDALARLILEAQAAQDAADKLRRDAADKKKSEDDARAGGTVKVNVAPPTQSDSWVGPADAKNKQTYYHPPSDMARTGDLQKMSGAITQLASDVDNLRGLVQSLAAAVKQGPDISGLQATLAQVVKVQIEQAKAIADLARARGSDMKGLFAGMANLRMRRASPRAADAVLDGEAAME